MAESTTRIIDTKTGSGRPSMNGDTLEVHYTGSLEDGLVFDRSRDRNRTFSFKLGQGQVIRGWDLGLSGLQVGGVRTLTIPPSEAFGQSGAGGVIPANATVIYEVELISLR